MKISGSRWITKKYCENSKLRKVGMWSFGEWVIGKPRNGFTHEQDRGRLQGEWQHWVFLSEDLARTQATLRLLTVQVEVTPISGQVPYIPVCVQGHSFTTWVCTVHGDFHFENSLHGWWELWRQPQRTVLILFHQATFHKPLWVVTDSFVHLTYLSGNSLHSWDWLQPPDSSTTTLGCSFFHWHWSQDFYWSFILHTDLHLGVLGEFTIDDICF